MRIYGAGGMKTVAVLLLLTILAACSGSTGPLASSEPEPQSAPPPAAPPPAPSPPPVDLAGRWRLTGPQGAGCFMTLTADPGAAQGKIAPEGGCPGNFFTSRKWTFEHGMLVIRDFKGQSLAQLSHSGDRFTGQDKSGAAVTLAK
jgi:hypothetical protein